MKPVAGMTARADHSREIFWPLGVVLAVFAIFTAWLVCQRVTYLVDFFIPDDAFYYLKTADNLAHGRGSTFDGVNSTNGYHPLWLLIQTCVCRLNLGKLPTVRVVFLVDAAFYAAGMIVAYRAILRLGIRPLVAAAGVGAIFVGVVPICGWNLLETGLTLLLSAGSLLVMLRIQRDSEARVAQRTPDWLLGLMLSLAALSRVDHGMLLMIGGAWAVCRPAENLATRARRAVALAIPAVLLFGGYLTWNYLCTGYFQPVTGRVKSLHTLPELRRLLDFITWDGPRDCYKLGLWFACGVVALDLRRRRLSAWGAYCLAAAAIWAYYEVRLKYSSYWYFVPLYLCAAAAVATLLQVLPERLAGRRQVLVSAAAAVGLFLLACAYRGVLFASYLHREPGLTVEIYRATLRLNELTRPGQRAAAWNAGIPGYFATIPVTNLDGLVNSHQYFDQYLSKGRDYQYIAEQKFDWIIDAQVYFEQPGWQPLAGDYTVREKRGQTWLVQRKPPP